MQSLSDRPVKTFSVGFEEPRYDEAPHAKRIARHLKTDHHEIYLKPADCLDVVQDLPSIFDEPFADSSQIPTYLISRVARERVTVVLSGDGGDELFAGYGRYHQILAFWRSEEHTSELQSLMRISYAVFCLTKKKHDIQANRTHT